MTKQEQINALRADVELIKAKLGLMGYKQPDSGSRLEIPNSSEYGLPDFIPDWKDAPEDARWVAMDKNGGWFWWRKMPIAGLIINGNWSVESQNGISNIKASPGKCTNASRLHPDYWKNSLMERPVKSAEPAPGDWSTAPEWANWKAMDADKRWFWFEGEPELDDGIGIWRTPLKSEHIPNHPATDKDWKDTIEKRPATVYHVAVHEAVTAEPDPYQVDWSKAPDYADSHSFQSDGYGWWHGSCLLGNNWADLSEQSGYTLPSGLDWKQSKRRRPE
jgi:hypothetical protein